MKVHLTTLGCPKNQVDSELMLGLLDEAGFALTTHAEEAECLIVNTCAFIDRAREESVQTILELAQAQGARPLPGARSSPAASPSATGPRS